MMDQLQRNNLLYQLIFMPLQIIFEVIYYLAFKLIGNPGVAIIALSFVFNLLVLPLYNRADAIQEDLVGNGDFRSAECLEILDECDIPFFFNAEYIGGICFIFPINDFIVFLKIKQAIYEKSIDDSYDFVDSLLKKINE